MGGHLGEVRTVPLLVLPAAFCAHVCTVLAVVLGYLTVKTLQLLSHLLLRLLPLLLSSVLLLLAIVPLPAAVLLLASEAAALLASVPTTQGWELGVVRLALAALRAAVVPWPAGLLLCHAWPARHAPVRYVTLRVVEVCVWVSCLILRLELRHLLLQAAAALLLAVPVPAAVASSPSAIATWG